MQIKDDWLMNPDVLIPEVLRSADGYNVAIAVGSYFESSGFYFKELSLFSLILTIGVLELALFRRSLRLGVMELAMVVTYCATGLTVLAASLLLIVILHNLARLALALAVGAPVVASLWDVPDVNFTRSRIKVFTDPRAGTYAGYVAPVRLVSGYPSADTSTFWLRIGPGAITRLAGLTSYRFNDTTRAKMLREDRVPGLAALVALAPACLRGSPMSWRVSAAIFACCLAMGGFLLTPEITCLPLLFGWLVCIQEEPATRPHDMEGRLVRLQ